MAKTFWDKREHGNWGRLVAEVCFLAFLLLFPLRHVTWGLDLWDTGYNYGNFTYADPKHMGSMWWFSTYLANLLGHLMTMLPFGNTLVGLNVYTGLLAGGISILGYFFCTRTLKFPAGITFAGEVLALCMCWCPTAKLYDYLTYLFFLLCCILLYRGLTEEKKGFLVLAGICLGCNLFVRFSNLPEAGMILAVWAFAFLDSRGRFWKRAAADTLWCLAGYLIPLALGFGWIAARYGLAEYGSGIRLLFAMTETATDYRASSMLYGLIWPFREGIYWVIRILVFVLGASLPVFVTDLFLLILPGKRKGKRGNPEKLCSVTGGVAAAGITVWMVYWLYTKREPSFTSFYYRSYDPIFWPGVLFLMIALGICTLEIFRRGNTKAEKLQAGMLILVIFLTSLGSNNGIYPSFNNLFLAAPYVLWQLVRFSSWACRRAARSSEGQRGLRWNLIPATISLWALVLMFSIQVGMFGLKFAFCEGTGIQETGYPIENNRVLKGVTAGRERARYLSEISLFAAEKELAGQEVILYGEIPALSFYLEMPPAFHSWCDLPSYHYTTMESTVKELAGEIEEKGRQKPVVIAEKSFAPYGPMREGEPAEKTQDRKWELIRSFMGRYGYEKTFENEKFVIWQAE